MKKTLLRILPVFLALALFALPVLADAPDPYVYVSVADANGAIALAAKKLPLSDGATLDDALRAAHEANYKGGSSGYGSAETTYGISLTKLWGDESGTFGYQVIRDGKPLSVSSLSEPLQNGDRLYAYVYTDKTNFSDVFSYFDQISVTRERGGTITLTLSSIGFDESWNTVTSPLAGATITLDGEKTAFVTDENGTVTVKIDKTGDILISAQKDGMVLVPPCALVSVEAASYFAVPFVICAVLLIIAIGFIFLKKRKAR